jgi:DNA-binding CsgD family transcriptional regulator
VSHKDDRWAPPPRGPKPPTESVEPIDLYPNPLPPPRPPETRATILADLQAGLASLTDEELKVAQLWIYGRSVKDVCHFLKLNEQTVRKLWKRMRRKLREALVTGAGRRPSATAPVSPAAQPNTEVAKETGSAPA